MIVSKVYWLIEHPYPSVPTPRDCLINPLNDDTGVIKLPSEPKVNPE